MNKASNKYSHHPIKNHEEADTYVVNTYLVVGDILLLWYIKNKPTNLIEGLSNTIFYSTETTVLMNMYFSSSISPYQLIIRPDYPLGTGTKFTMLFQKNKKNKLTQAYDFRYSLPIGINVIGYDKLSKNEYLQIGTYIFGKSKNPFLIFALGDSLIKLKIAIFEYIPPKKENDIGEDNWKLVGEFSGQSHAYVQDDDFFLPYGTQGLYERYRLVGQEFVQINE